MVEKIKDIYSSEKLKGDDSLVIWYNKVIEKRADELTVPDVARCIRQNLFLDAAYEMLLVYLLQNPYEGDLYGGELMEKASEVDDEYIARHKKTITEIIQNAREFVSAYPWECEEDKTEYIASIEKLENAMTKIM